MTLPVWGASLEIKAQNVSAAGVFSGYASTFSGKPDSYGDVIQAGAFGASLRKHQQEGRMPLMLWQHDVRQPIGAWQEFKEDNRGLFATGKLTLGTRLGAETHALLKDNALSGLSIGYTPLASAPGKGEIRRVLTKVELHEVSIVSMPANSEARVTAVKSAIAGPADLQRVLQQIGYSQREAKRLVAGGWPAFTKTDPSPELDAAVSLLSNSTAAVIALTRSSKT